MNQAVINYQFDKKFTKLLIPLDLTKVFFIILHHIQAKIASIDDIHKWHIENGWNGFGYNEYIRKDGSCYIGRGDFIGAQCSGMNSKSYGIALEGDFSNENQMTIAQFNTLIKRLKFHKSRLPNMVRVKPHNYFVDTECPAKFFPMQEVYNSLEENTKIMDLEFKIILLQDEIKSLKKEIEFEKSVTKKVREDYKNLYNINQKNVLELQNLKK